jgi:UDP-glucuronate decarboxylase
LCPEEALGQGRGSTEACYDDKTETLTKNGWKKYLELTNEDLIATYNPKTKLIEYCKPIDPVEKHIYDHKGPMIKFKSQKLDMLVTPEHRMWVNKNPTTTKEEWKFVSAEEILNSNSHWAIKSRVESKDYDKDFTPKQPIIDLMKFIGYFISEGSINSNEPYCRLSQKKEDSAYRMREVIYSNYPEFKESYSEEKGYEWHWYNKELYNMLKEFGDNCYNRYIPRVYLDYQPEYLKHLLFAALDGDGTFDTREGRNTCEYTTTSKQLADNIQEIAVKCGYRTHIIFSEDNRENRVGVWRVRIDLSEKDYIVITPEMCEKVYYEGKVHCLNVPNHIYLTRRNNKLAIQGNTAKVKQMMYEKMIRAFQLRMSDQIKEELINFILIKNGFREGSVKLRFNSVADSDEAVKAKWLGDLLRGFPEGELPFTIDEIRAMFSFGPKTTEVATDETVQQPTKPQEIVNPIEPEGSVQTPPTEEQPQREEVAQSKVKLDVKKKRRNKKNYEKEE